MFKIPKRRMQKSGNPVAALFNNISPNAETSPDAGRDEIGPRILAAPLLRAVFHRTGRPTRCAPWPRCYALHEQCEREPADGAEVFRQNEWNTHRADASSSEHQM